MAQHVGMDREWQLSRLAKPFNQLLGTVDREWRLALGQEHEVCVRMLAAECPQQPQLVTLQPVNARRAVLGAADMDGRAVQIDLLPADVGELADPERMPKRYEDQQPVAGWVAAI